MAKNSKNRDVEIVFERINDLFEVVNNKISRQAARDMAWILLENSKNNAPEETGALKASGKITTQKEGSGRGIKNYEVFVEFGGDTPVVDKNSRDGIVDYAAIVHDTNTEFLFLGLEDSQGEFDNIMANAAVEIEAEAKRKSRSK